MGANHSHIMVEAASTGKLDLLEQLLAKENPAEETIQTLLIAAAWKSQTSIVKYLLSNYPSVVLPFEFIRAAIFSSSPELFSALLSKDPAIINRHIETMGTPLAFACFIKRPIEFLEFLLKAGADPNNNAYLLIPTPLESVAARYDDTRVADLLLKYGAELDSETIDIAVSEGDEVMACYLKERRDNMKDSPTTPGPASSSN
ncbi:hypothetical protein OCU04_008017 [Sclerotinia nivalis]|uniref:Ankyrin repeat-containing protein n=1 Tax=Sclerotinia nivalis TaxID=352851 RepID=A0A9X0AKS8_9HELO|nr:hypothetical protein OCU04_008017 [Sclerotinia nivalis]